MDTTRRERSQKRDQEKEISKGEGENKEDPSSVPQVSRQSTNEQQLQAQSREEDQEQASHSTAGPLGGQGDSLGLPPETSARDILRPLSEDAAQRGFLLPTSGSLAWLVKNSAETESASADRGQTYPRDGDSGGTRSSSGSSSMLPQSQALVDATATTWPDISVSVGVGHGVSGGVAASAPSATNAGVNAAGGSRALQDFTAALWQRASITPTRISLPTTPAAAAAAAAAPKLADANRPSIATDSSSPPGSPTSSVVSAEASSSIFEAPSSPPDDPQQPPIEPSPFASIFPEGTSTYPLFIQRWDESDESDSNNTILKYSESIQLFRRRTEDGGKIWKRRVLEYR